MRAWRDGDLVRFECPGCGTTHAVTIGNGTMTPGDGWKWNGRFDRPTFYPSVKVSDGAGVRCHSWITDGRIKFLHDCRHKLANQEVDLPEVE